MTADCSADYTSNREAFYMKLREQAGSPRASLLEIGIENMVSAAKAHYNQDLSPIQFSLEGESVIVANWPLSDNETKEFIQRMNLIQQKGFQLQVETLR